MDYIIAAQTEAEFQHYHRVSKDIQPILENFLKFLKAEYAVNELPNTVVLTNLEIATQSLSNIPLPGYTNEFRTVFCPDIHSWRKIYLHQLDDHDNQKARHFYETELTQQHILQILGHEFVHHSDLFIDEAYDKARWFEEGMCEYISRKYFLSESQFQESIQINRIIVELQQINTLRRPLEDFSSSTYSHSYSCIFYEYWRSFLAVHQIIDRFEGDIHKVFAAYREWYQYDPRQSLSNWFHVSI